MRNITTIAGIVSAATLVSTVTSQAAVLAEYTFKTSSDSVADRRASSDVDPNSSGEPFGVGSGFPNPNIDTSNGVSFSTSGNPGLAIFVRVNETGTDEETAVSSNNFFSFTVTPDVGYVLNLTELTFDTGRNANFTGNWAVRSSVNGFATTIGDVFVHDTPAYVTRTVELDAATYQGVSEAVTFRLYVWDNNSNGSNANRLDNVILSGESVVPEPSALVSLMGGVGLLLARRRRGRIG